MNKLIINHLNHKNKNESNKGKYMNNIIEHTYTSLANTDELRLTKKDYSMNYLGRCKSDYAYLKSTGRQASTDVLLRL